MKRDTERDQQRLADLQAKQAQEAFLKEEAILAEQAMLQSGLSNPSAQDDFAAVLARVAPTYAELYDAWCLESRRRRELEPKNTGQDVYFAGYDTYRKVFEEIHSLHPWFFPPGIWSPPVLTPEEVATFRRKFEAFGRGPLRRKKRIAASVAEATESPRGHTEDRQTDADPTPTGETVNQKDPHKPTR